MSKQYHNAIDHWTPNDPGSLVVKMQDIVKVQVMPQRKREYEHFGRDDERSGSGSRLLTEEVFKSRCDSQWAWLGIVSGARDCDSE